MSLSHCPPDFPEIVPDGTFEELSECPKCWCSDSVHYYDQYPHIRVECSNCGFIKFTSHYKKSEWSRAVKERDEYTCQRCGKRLTGRALHAHHKMPEWFMPNLQNRLDNGITLCNACHRQLHGKDGSIRNSAGL